MLVVPRTAWRIVAPFPSSVMPCRFERWTWPLTLYVPPALKQTTEPFALASMNDWRADVTSVAPVASTLTVRVQEVGGGVVVGVAVGVGAGVAVGVGVAVNVVNVASPLVTDRPS